MIDVWHFACDQPVVRGIGAALARTVNSHKIRAGLIEGVGKVGILEPVVVVVLGNLRAALVEEA